MMKKLPMSVILMVRPHVVGVTCLSAYLACHSPTGAIAENDTAYTHHYADAVKDYFF